MTYVPYDPATFPDEINHPFCQTLVIDRSRLVAFNLDAIAAFSLGQAASLAERSIVESLLQQPRDLALRKVASVARELGIRIEDGADQPKASRVNHTPWQLWLRSEGGEAITQQRLTKIGEQFRSILDWPNLLVGSVYRMRETTGTTSLLSPLPHVLGVRLRVAVADQSDEIAEGLSRRHGLMESDISQFLPRHYRCFFLKDFKTRPVYRLRDTILNQESAYVEELFFDYMPLFVPTGAFTPNDPYYQPNQWNLLQINAVNGWNLQNPPNPPILGANVTVAIIDDGCEVNGHPDLQAGTFATGITITYTGMQTPGGGAPQNESHGTQCAGIVGARMDNREGITGIAGHCLIMPIRVEAYTELSISAAIGYASSNGARVISMSFGGEPASVAAYSTQVVRDAIAEAFTQKNVVLCAATMNNNQQNFIPYPAAYPGVIACGASDHDDNRWTVTRSIYGSNYGQDPTSGGKVSVVAPGMDIPTTANIGQGDLGNPRNYTGHWSGTSAATPHVAALAALMISAKPTLTSQEVKNYIELTADKVPTIGGYTVPTANGLWGPELGYGRINVHKALQKALGLIP